MRHQFQYLAWTATVLVLLSANAPSVQAACCYFSAKNTDILQPAQKVFITWNPEEKLETFTVQPKFEGNALDFGMVIPTPTQPKLNEMPRDFFKHLAVYTIMRKRELAHSKLLPLIEPRDFDNLFLFGAPAASAGAMTNLASDKLDRAERKPAIKVLEVGTVGSLDYKIIEA